MTRALLDHLVSRIGSAKLETDPFPYFYVEDIFPNEIYERLLSCLPERHKFFPPAHGGIGKEHNTAFRDINAYRSQIFVNPHPLERLPPDEATFWRELSTTLDAEAFSSTLVSLVHLHLKARLVGRADVRMHASSVLVRNGKGYSLAPHTDSPTKLVSLVFYLPKDATRKELGTVVYAPRAPTLRCSGERRHDPSDFDIVEIAPYVPNAVFGFVKTDSSFHGVHPLTDVDFFRDTLAYNLVLSGS